MKMMGLKQHTYWFVTYLFAFVLYMIATLFSIIIAVILQFNYFTNNNFGIYFILFILWGNTMIALALLMSVFFTDSSTSMVVGYLYVFGTGVISSTVIQTFFSDESTPTVSLFFIQIVPSFALFRGLWSLRDGVAYGNPGLGWGDLNLPYIHIKEVYGYLIVEWIIFLLLAAYFEAVWPNGIGTVREPFFICRRSFWSREEKRPVSVPSNYTPDHDDVPEDVQAAGRLAHQDTNASVRTLGLNKVYQRSGDSNNIFNSCKKQQDGEESTSTFTAVHNLSMSIHNNTCFGFLGSNGAGKSTTINMLCGYLQPTNGAAYLCGYNVVEEPDSVHMIMGVCPQAGEHLYFYGMLKGMTGAELEHAVNTGLSNVQLLDVKNKRSSEYSGGMKRRLCVAISLMGQPQVILLDEPTTGLDPGARNSLWEVIRNYKKSSTILLTTHSMEEAEYLCDQIGIFEHGQLRCIGTSAELKLRYEKGYKLTIHSSSESNVEAIFSFVQQLAPQHALLNSISQTYNFEIPKTSIKLSAIFTALEANKSRLKILDWGISNTTLEEVFVRIASNAVDQEIEVQHNGGRRPSSANYAPQPLTGNGPLPESIQLVNVEQQPVTIHHS